ncbi:MFS transporter [Megamonas funiformis]|uniref:MFS transporter n=1 Tax=Megamonas funiformis TaxID=437897 RepID=UPI0035662385
MPVKEKMSYGSQLKILKDINLWWALIAVILLNGANFGVYSYLADYLERVSLLSTEFVSITLLIFGLANILGNVIAGRLLSQRPLLFVGIYPFLLTVLFLVMLFLGNMGFVIMGIVLIWGILVGCAANINQYWITRVASNVPDFANALFLVATNVGTCIAAFVCGIFIDEFGINNVVLGGILFTVLSIGFFFAGIKKSPKEKMLKVNKAV